jgi:hypothetical protein
LPEGEEGSERIERERETLDRERERERERKQETAGNVHLLMDVAAASSSVGLG